MAQNQSDVKLRLSAETAGVEGIKELSKEIRDVAKAGGDAAPQFERLANELDELAKQQALIDQLSKVNKEVDEVNASLTQGRAKVEDYRRALDEQRATLAPLQQAYDGVKQRVLDAKDAVTNANIAWREAKARQAELRSEVQAGERATKEQIAAQRAAADVVKETKKALEDARLAQAKVNVENVKAKDAYDTVAKAVAKTEGELKRVEKQADRTEQQYAELNREVTKISTAMSKVGVDSTNMANAQVKVAQAIQRVTTEAQSLDAALGTVADELRRAFDNSTLGRIKALTDEIDRLERGYMDLARSGKYSDEQLRQMATGVKARVAEAKGEIDKLTNGVDKLGDTARDSKLPLDEMAASVAAAFTVDKFVEANVQMDAAKRTLTALAGSAEAGAEEMEYVRVVAERLGLELSSTAKQYASLIAATKSSGISVEQTRGTFEAVAGAMSVLGRSAADTEGALLALQQMASKGNVTMEELRQQLGDRLPGALSALAKELGLTDKQLNDLVQSGGLLARDVFPALESALKKTFKVDGQIESLQAQINRLKNATTELFVSVGDTGVLEAAIEAVKVFVLGALQGFTAVKTVVSQTATAVAFLVEQTKALATFDVDRMRANYQALKDQFADVEVEAERAQAGVTRLAMSLKMNADQTDATAKSAEGLADSNAKVDASFVPIGVRVGELDKAYDGQIATQNKLIRMTEEQVTASNKAAAAFGDEAQKALTAANGAAAMTAALESQLAVRQSEIPAAQAALAQINQYIAAGGAQTEAVTNVSNALRERIQLAEADVLATQSQIREQGLLEAQMRTQAQTVLDNSSRLGVLAAAYDRARQEAERLRIAVDQGRGSQDQLAAAEQRAGQAKLLYNDAVRDQIAKLEAERNAKVASISVDQAGVQLALEQQMAIRDVAAARGEDAVAMKAANEIRKLEYQLAQLAADAKRVEAEAAREATKVQIEQIKSKQQLTAEDRANIATLESSVRLKEKEAQVAGEVAKKFGELAESSGNLDRKKKQLNETHSESIRLLEAEKTAAMETVDAETASMQLGIQQLKVRADLAAVNGDEEEATKLLNEVKALELELAAKIAEAKKIEAEASIRVAEAKIRELSSLKERTAEQEAELDRLEASVGSLREQAAIHGETAGLLRELAAATRAAGSAAKEAGQATYYLADATKEAAEAARQAAEHWLSVARAKASDADASNAAASAAQKLVQLDLERQKTALAVAEVLGDETAAAVARNEIRRLEIALAEAAIEVKKAEIAASNAKAEVQIQEIELQIASGELTKDQIRVKNAEIRAIRASVAARRVELDLIEESARRVKELDRAETIRAKNAASRPTVTPRPDPVASSVAPPADHGLLPVETSTDGSRPTIDPRSSSSKPAVQSTVTINLGGKATQINVTSAQDAHNLTNVLKQLEQASGSAY